MISRRLHDHAAERQQAHLTPALVQAVRQELTGRPLLGVKPGGVSSAAKAANKARQPG